MTSVTILIPTRYRPEPLARALASLAALDVPAGVAVDVLVVDNAADGTAHETVAAANLPFPAETLREARPGVSSARNAGVRAARGEIIAFVDDDCAADPGWLAAQVHALAGGADGSFGPRVARIDGTAPAGADFFLETYSRDLGEPAGTDVSARHAHLPLPGAAFVKARCLAGDEPFDRRLDHIGAEDVLLFRQLVEDGRRFVWTPDARMVEFIPPARLNAGFILRRRYLSGQHRCLVPMMLEPPRRGEMLGHMAKGGVAAALMAPLALAGRLRGTWPSRPTGLLMSGLGKLTWWRVKNSRLYGSGHR